MPRSMERSRTMLFLLCVCLAIVLAGYVIYRHKSSNVQPSSEMKTGVKVLTDPESVVKDLEKE
jgi:hypothetical protein